MGVGDLLELLKTLDVVLGRLATGAGARSRDGIGGLYQDIEHRVGVDIGMVSLDSVDDDGLLAITAGKLGADDGMRALDVMVDCLAQVVQQAGRAWRSQRPGQARKPSRRTGQRLRGSAEARSDQTKYGSAGHQGS